MLKLNLLPRQYVLRQMQRRANRLILLLCGAAAIALCISAWTCLRWKGEAERYVSMTAESSQEAEALADRVKEASAGMDTAVRSAERHASLLDRLPVSRVLATVTNALPEHASLTAIDLDTSVTAAPRGRTGGGKASADAGTARGSDRPAVRQKLTVTGTAATDVDVANFMAGLGRSALVEQVELVHSQEKLVENRTVREFLVEINFKPGADAMDTGADTAGRTASRGPVARGPGASEGT